MLAVRTILLLLTLPLCAAGQMTVGLMQNDSLAYDGLTLFCPNASTDCFLIDNCGKEVNRWSSTTTPGLSAYILDDGSLLRTGNTSSSVFSAGGIGGKIERFSWDGTLEWSYEYATDDYHLHHDIAPMPNGNILAVAWEARSYSDAVDEGRDPGNTPAPGVWPTRVVEIQPIGTDSAEIVWRWSIWDHLIQDFDSTKLNYGVVADHPEKMDVNYFTGSSSNPDWIHVNSIDYDPVNDLIVLSSRSLSEIWVIDHSTTSAEAKGGTGGNFGRGRRSALPLGQPAGLRQRNWR